MGKPKIIKKLNGYGYRLWGYGRNSFFKHNIREFLKIKLIGITEKDCDIMEENFRVFQYFSGFNPFRVG
jgi:hypothetical protein